MAKKIKNRPKSKEEKRAAKEAEAEAEALAAQGVDDEFQAKGREVVEKASENRGLILGALGLVVVIGIGLGISQFMTQSENAEASTMYAKALEAYQAPTGEALPGEAEAKIRFKDEKERSMKAREQFKSVIAKQPGSKIAQLAQLYVGHTSSALGEHDAALEAYRAFKNNTERSDPTYFAGADGEASALEAKGDIDGAISVLSDRLKAPRAVGRDIASLNLARLYKAKGDTTNAKATLEAMGENISPSLKLSRDELLASVQ